MRVSVELPGYDVTVVAKHFHQPFVVDLPHCCVAPGVREVTDGNVSDDIDLRGERLACC